MDNLESYKHKSAKEVLAGWLSSEFIVRVEEDFKWFIPDISVYDENGIKAFYEVVHESCLTGKKLGRIQFFAYQLGIKIPVYEVECEWILKQVKKPRKLTHIKSILYEL